ncbi:hydroxyisourate hydrolase [Riemerella anatipestifer]|uniref:5-hydroxyisourate hydrolase n=1 Tax=Riemerella anatipestifer (strain ATCC 11845 / DSM 15868 / JCM 9532 / NCTC 11014) TaxID=693978 RepID=E4TB54_RIEAD|nr:hydroxyisourate hydrolase [Riemerella anatipestifer]ADQ81290.1 hydroxyisourate hydrolase [Riemerella anatipestifer ATCC 11845 = DSM 15868]ADZ11227.1 Transthyretin-like protein [Riemerella anatipestifer RA-GD]AFD55312.1 hydroxyisourate hydrolase [Riemerella anatipestifer ATCC 11845 = DSM 15868]AKQ38861.1 hydroxyisourate hydrolase [Riemerella anatipestifer Yb2]MBT0526233.1 hydroxyisourate hydrolase [Riemerella anatipestifer]
MKKSSFLVLILAFTSFMFAQEAKYQLSSHILDITQGQPASGVTISLSKMNNTGNWIKVDEKITDSNGRIRDFLKEEKDINHQGIYRLTYFTKPYFDKLGQKSFYPFIEVVFEIKDNSHYHVPITLSPYGYSTYRGN